MFHVVSHSMVILCSLLLSTETLLETDLQIRYCTNMISFLLPEETENRTSILLSTKGYNKDFQVIEKPYRLLLSLDVPSVCVSSRSAEDKM